MVTPILIAEIGIGATTTVKGLCHVRQFSVFVVLFTINIFFSFFEQLVLRFTLFSAPGDTVWAAQILFYFRVIESYV